MAIYTIANSDLDPEIVARFEHEEDEGVYVDLGLGGGGGGGEGVGEGNVSVNMDEVDQKESLRILGCVMRSRIEGQTPMRRLPVPLLQPLDKTPRKPSPPRSRSRNSPSMTSNPDSSSSSSPPPPRRTQTRNKLHTIPDDKELSLPLPLAPSTSKHPIPQDHIFSLQQREHHVKKSASSPNLSISSRARGDRGVVSREGMAVNGSGMGRAQTESITEKLNKTKRSSIFGGALGAVRDAFGGGKKGGVR